MRAFCLLVLSLAGGLLFTARAQVPQGAQLRQHPSWSSYRETAAGKKLDSVITGASASDLDAYHVLVNQFELRSFHNGDPKRVQLIAQAPQCKVDVSQNVAASDPGPLQIFTPTTNLFVQGVGFLFTQTNHLLIISNQVETRVLKSLLRSSMLAAPLTNAGAEAGQVVKVFAEHGWFDLDSNVVDYAGNVHMIDPQLDMTSDLLTIRFTTNGAVESILARQNVVLTTTNNGRATGATGLYYVTNGNEMMQLTTDAAWRNGDEEARANEFTYDSTRHLLTGIGHVRVDWPNVEPNAQTRATNSTGLLAGTNGFRKLFADFATLQFPPTNGPVESMLARGNVIIVNQADQSSAMADQAVYEKVDDRVELTGNPVWWNNDMEVKAQTLSAELGGKIYHARTNARFKMRTGGGAANQPVSAPGRSANQWLFVASDDMEYRTNQARFSGNVQSRLVENGRLRDILNCRLLTLGLTNNQVESASARDNVHGETAPDASGLVKTITCEQLNAWRCVQTGLMRSVDAHTNVVIEDKGTGPGAPFNKLTADTVTAQFSSVTNQIEQAEAWPNVVLDQSKGGHKIHATGRRAVYTAGVNDRVTLTGAPVARRDNYLITGSDPLIWLPKSNYFQAFGLYKMDPITVAASTK
ncbi:MAG: LptA/OstA family protein [Limisphaerales bacterium]